jgi:uncharacterized tellurite resistance protein B-like protein
MQDEERAIIQALLPVAWADGDYGAAEQEMLRGILEGYHASEAESAEFFDRAKEQVGLDSIDLNELSAGDRRVVLSHAVLLTFADGIQHPAENTFLGELAAFLRIPAAEAKEVIDAAEARAKQHLGDLA